MNRRPGPRFWGAATAAFLVLYVAFWGAVAFVIIHFLVKAW